MADYEYTREQLASGDHAGMWDINNPDRVDGEGNQILLAEEVQTALPGKQFKLNCNDGTATFTFVDSLTTEEESTLDTTVANHKNNV